MSIFVTRHDFYAIEMYFEYLRRCFPEIRDQVAFHLMFPNENLDEFDHKTVNESRNKVATIVSKGYSCSRIYELSKTKFVFKR